MDKPLEVAYVQSLLLLKECSNFLSLYISEAGGCDHDAGICICDMIRLQEQVQEAIKDA